MFFHSFLALLCPMMEAKTPSLRALREILREFYSNTIEQLNQSLQWLLTIDFDVRHREFSDPNEWEGFEDTLCLALIYCVRFSLLTVLSTVHKSLMNHQEVTGRMRDGRRLSHPHDLECVLIYFNNELHYGVGIPV